MKKIFSITIFFSLFIFASPLPRDVTQNIKINAPYKVDVFCNEEASIEITLFNQNNFPLTNTVVFTDSISNIGINKEKVSLIEANEEYKLNLKIMSSEKILFKEKEVLLNIIWQDNNKQIGKAVTRLILKAPKKLWQAFATIFCLVLITAFVVIYIKIGRD